MWSSILNILWIDVSHVFWHITNFILSSSMPVFCVKSARNLNIFSMYSYDSFLLINWIIKWSKSLLLIITSIWNVSLLFLLINYCLWYDLILFYYYNLLHDVGYLLTLLLIFIFCILHFIVVLICMFLWFFLHWSIIDI